MSNKNNEGVSKSFFLTRKTFEELHALEKDYCENRSRIVNRLINEAFFKMQQKKEKK